MKCEISLKDRIVRYLQSRQGDWINGGEIERQALLAGYKASNSSRRCRELYVENKLDRMDNEDGTVSYRYHSINT